MILQALEFRSGFMHLNCPAEWKHPQIWTFLAVTRRYLMKKMHIFHKFEIGISCLSLNLLLLFCFGKRHNKFGNRLFFSLLFVILHHHKGKSKRFCTAFCDLKCMQMNTVQIRPRCSYLFFVCIRFVLFGWFLRVGWQKGCHNLNRDHRLYQIFYNDLIVFPGVFNLFRTQHS